MILFYNLVLVNRFISDFGENQAKNIPENSICENCKIIERLDTISVDVTNINLRFDSFAKIYDDLNISGDQKIDSIICSMEKINTNVKQLTQNLAKHINKHENGTRMAQNEMTQNDFKIVHKNRKPKATEPKNNLSLKNRFAVLESEDSNTVEINCNESNGRIKTGGIKNLSKCKKLREKIQVEIAKKAYLIGDITFKGQHKYMANKLDVSYQVTCHPGANISKMIKVVKEFEPESRQCPLILGVGKENVISKENEFDFHKIENSCTTLLDTLKEKSKRPLCVGILPNLKQNSDETQMLKNINLSLKTMCTERDIKFCDFTPTFYQNKELFANEGLNLNNKGKTKLANLIHLNVNYLLMNDKTKIKSMNKNNKV